MLMSFAISNLLKKRLIYMFSHAAWPKAMYLVLVIEIETVCCFLLHKDTITVLIKNNISLQIFNLWSY